MSHAMVDAHQRLVPQQGQGAGSDGDAGQRSAHAGTLGEADAVDVGGRDAGFGNGAARKGDELGAVVQRRVFGEEARAWGGDEGVSQVREDGG